MTHQEEVRVKLGVDSSAIGPGMTSAGNQLMSIGKNIVTRFRSMLLTNFQMAFATVAAMAFKEFSYLIPYTQAWYEKLLGYNEEASKSFAALADRIRTLRRELEASRKSLEEKQFDFRLKNATPEQQLRLIADRIKQNEAQQRTHERSIESAAKYIQTLDKDDPKRLAASESIAKSQMEINRLKTAHIDLSEKESDIEEQIADKKAQQAKLEKQRLADEQKRLALAAQRVAEAAHSDRDSHLPTVADLANSGYMRWVTSNSGSGWVSGPFAGEGRAITNMDKQIQNRFAWGDVAGGEDLLKRRNALYDSLAAKGILRPRPEKLAEDQLNELQMLNSAMKTKTGTATVHVALADTGE